MDIKNDIMLSRNLSIGGFESRQYFFQIPL